MQAKNLRSLDLLRTFSSATHAQFKPRKFHQIVKMSLETFRMINVVVGEKIKLLFKDVSYILEYFHFRDK